MNQNETNYIRDRLLAYLFPQKPQTEEQLAEFERAVTAQAEYESNIIGADVASNVSQMSNDGVSISFYGGRIAQYTDDTISPNAWAILRNAGLIAYSLPTARPTRSSAGIGGSRYGH